MTVRWKDVTRLLCYHRLSDVEWNELNNWMQDGKEPEEILENLHKILENRAINNLVDGEL